jgi:hypothetical protein
MEDEYSSSCLLSSEATNPIVATEVAESFAGSIIEGSIVFGHVTL